MKKVYVKDRIQFAVNYISNNKSELHSVCDLGCRDKILQRSLNSSLQYLGVDIYPVDKTVLEASIEEILPINDSSYDLVTALDVLEHTNDIEKAISELRRICRKAYIVNLPNELNLIARLKLMSGKISGKFLINLGSKDRHRWFFTQENVDRLVNQSEFSSDRVQIYALYKKSRFYGRCFHICGIITGLHSLFCHSYIIVGEKQ